MNQSKGTKVIEKSDGVTCYRDLKDYYVMEDYWITEHNKVLYDSSSNEFKVLDFKEIEKDKYYGDGVVGFYNPEKHSCIKLDRDVVIGEILYTQKIN